VKRVFGDDILYPDKTINREKLATIIFNDPGKRRRLNKITHKLIALEILNRIVYYFFKGSFFSCFF
jgi:dephospho-CoA kinase